MKLCGFTLGVLIFALLACCLVAPSDGALKLKWSALNALQSSIDEFSKPVMNFRRASEGVHKIPTRETQGSDPACVRPRPVSAKEQGRRTTYPATQEPQKRKRVTPHQAKVCAANFHWKCAMCGEILGPDFQVDHIIPLHQGGGHSIDNFQPLHPRCHAKKNSREQMTARHY